MISLQVIKVITLTTLLATPGLLMLMPKPTIGQSTPCVSTAQSAELAEAEQLHQQIIKLYNEGKYSKAIPLAECVLDIFRKVLGEEHLDVAQSLNNLAELYRKESYYSKAEPLHLQALKLRKRLLGEKHFDVANSLSNLALLYTDQGRFREAEPLFLQARKICEDLKEHLLLAITLNALSSLYVQQGRYNEAEPLLLRSLYLRKSLLRDDDPSVTRILSNLAMIYVRQKRFPEAINFQQQALEIDKRLLGEHPAVATHLANLASIYDILGRYSEAENLFLQAFEMRKRLFGQRDSNVASSLDVLAHFYWMQGKTAEALNFHKQVLDIEEYYLNLNLVAGFERQKRDYIATFTESTNNTISVHLNSAPKNPKAARLAFATVLQRKGRILDILTNSQQILRQHLNEPDNQKLLDELSDTRRQLANLVFSKPDKFLLEEYRAEVAKLDTQAKQLEDKLSRRSEEFRIQSQPVTVEAIQKLIPTDTALIEIVKYEPWYPKINLLSSITINGNPLRVPELHYGKPRYAVYVLLAKGEPKGIDLGDAETIQKTLELFRDDLRDKDTPITQVKQSARDLDKILMQPVRKLLGKTRKILLSPDSALNLIPFEALVDESDRYLVENYSFTYLTSGRDLLRLQNHFSSKQPPLIIADPNFDRSGEVIARQPHNNNSQNTRSIDLSQKIFSPLPGTAEEAKAIATLLEVKPLTGTQATEGAVKQIKNPRILHIATHGFFENATQAAEKITLDDNPLLLSGLVLAGLKPRQSGGEDGILTALETTALNLVGTKLVVLSACDTGLGNIFAGEGIYGLRRALVIAGSESQMISLWKVADDATKELMVAHYKKLLDNKGRSEALRQTQLEMLGSEKYQHPYYWAAFIPSGDWRAMEK
ncbi:CHAT domain-containing tetratricopeptide repeat protein [Nostoc sp. ChiQUE01b]|uniref:CHAT domain-containing tetratricopeptide repeat protein n=1 Tax=Nostoc sp. ChiQUE01b TaxID=3075376 RepID=UPI002AD54F17|nr:CHAT domain-containing tetratricopeptide repeat protein [Nostoc sp. ChiQUE01b]MDZ8258437.1 CHAT domain-containing tetratricopeptide repeat protein [Nostoc sp. ChiQUE01b]